MTCATVGGLLLVEFPVLLISCCLTLPHLGEITTEGWVNQQQAGDPHPATRRRLSVLQILNIQLRAFLILLKGIQETVAAPQTLLIALLKPSVVVILAQTGH